MKQTKIYNKLVRDRIPFIIIEDGKTPKFSIIPESEYHAALSKKLQEEVHEYQAAESNEAAFAELIDIYEVLLTTVYHLGFTEDDLKYHARKKRIEKGGFQERILLEEVRE